MIIIYRYYEYILSTQAQWLVAEGKPYNYRMSPEVEAEADVVLIQQDPALHLAEHSVLTSKVGYSVLAIKKPDATLAHDAFFAFSGRIFARYNIEESS